MWVKLLIAYYEPGGRITIDRELKMIELKKKIKQPEVAVHGQKR